MILSNCSIEDNEIIIVTRHPQLANLININTFVFTLINLIKQSAI